MNECPVCFEGIKDTIPLPCKHWVCRVCVIKSNIQSKILKCPLCRHTFTLSEQEYWYIRYLIRSQK